MGVPTKYKPGGRGGSIAAEFAKSAPDAVAATKDAATSPPPQSSKGSSSVVSSSCELFFSMPRVASSSSSSASSSSSHFFSMLPRWSAFALAAASEVSSASLSFSRRAPAPSVGSSFTIASSNARPLARNAAISRSYPSYSRIGAPGSLPYTEMAHREWYDRARRRERPGAGPTVPSRHAGGRREPGIPPDTHRAVVDARLQTTRRGSGATRGARVDAEAA